MSMNLLDETRKVDIDLYNLLKKVVMITVKETLTELGQIPRYIPQSKAYRLFGEGVVKRWVQEGLIKRHKDGNGSSRVRYDFIELEILAASNNRLTYLDSEERKQKI